MKPIFVLLAVFCIAAAQAKSTHWNSSEQKEENKQSRFRDRETAISEETNRLVQSLNERDSSESNSNEERNAVVSNIFQKHGRMGNWWQQPSVEPMLIKISQRVARTPSLQQEWKVKEIVKQTEDAFKYCKMGNQYDRGCMGARMGMIQKFITNLEASNKNDDQE